VSANPYGDAADQLLAQFYTWEQRGRGWDVYPWPVELEPPFRKFERYVRVPADVHDGRRPSGLLSLLTLGLAGRQRTLIPEGEPESPPMPQPAATGPIAELHVLLPDDFDPGRDTRALIRACLICSWPVSFELIGHAGVVSLQVACSAQDRPTLGRSIKAIAPDASVLARDGHLADTWQRVAGHMLIADLGLSEEFMRPLRPDGFGGDPLVQILAALGDAADDEVAVVQVIATPVRHNWAGQLLAALSDGEGKAFLPHYGELLAQAKHKVQSQLFACRIRLAAKARNRARSVELVRSTLAAFQQFAAGPAGNSLIALEHNGWDEGARQFDLLERAAHRSGMLLSADELAGIVHLPTRHTAGTALERARQRTKAAPPQTAGHELVLGENVHLGERRAVTLSSEQRSRHLYVIGGSGTGKSTLLLQLILQDIEAGRGVALLDPHGDLADAVLARIPPHRVDDVVLVDPSDAEYSVGINILMAHSETERTLLASDLVALFRRQSTSWGDQMNAVFANAVLAFLESNQGGTLPDLRRFLVEKDYRAAFLRTVADPEVVYYWEKQYPLLRGNAQAPILTRLDAFLRPKLVRHIVDSRGGSLDFRQLMDEQKILIVKLPQGAIGEENAYLLGSLIISKLQQLALSRHDVEASARPPFYLYVDEFHNFATPSMATLLSGVRKYGLALTLAHQNLGQLSTELVESVFANAGTRICFRVGERDGRKLADGFSYFEAHDLQNLDTGQAICRVGWADADFNLSTYPVEEIDAGNAQERTETVIAASRSQYARPRLEPPPLVLPPPAPAELPPARPVVHQPTPTAVSTPRAPIRARATPVTAGRGGQQHQYLQALVRRLGQDRGFLATVEQSVLDGVGSVDVALEREGLKIACEIWVTTPLDNEIKNLQKCLAAGFHHVVAISANEKGLKRLTTALESSVGESDRPRVHLITPDQLPQLLDSFTLPADQVETVGGYKVKVRYATDTDSDNAARSRTLHDVVARALKKLKNP
jgi:hypothetical protein